LGRNAVAAIIITAINLIGGFIIGLTKGMPLAQAIRELIDRPMGSGCVTPQVHANGGANQHRERELLARRQGIESPVEIQACGLHDAPAPLRVRHLIQIETENLRLG